MNIIEAIVQFFKNLFSMSKTKPAPAKKPTTAPAKPVKSSKRTLYALMVAIDRYAPPVPPLRGCVNDRDALKEYLERQFAKSKDTTLKIRTLTDHEATREGIIKAFNHFDAATPDDICLFFFSGHGSQAPSPKEFLHLDPDGMNESLVCFDSRNGAKDLMDKELSYLLWKATHGKNQHFITIFDCCHSGTITRNSVMTPRQAPAATFPTRLQEYFGHETFNITKQGNSTLASPPRGRIIQLGACKDQETAKETQINGRTRGLFTYNLVEVLEQNGGNLTYAELQHILQLRVGNAVRDQQPQLISTEPADKTLRFLGGLMPPADPSYLVQFDKGKWIMNAGLVQGIPEQGGDIELEDGAKVKIVKVNANNSEVEGMGNRNTQTIFRAFAKGLPFRKMKVAFAPNTDNTGKRVLNNTFKKYPSLFFDIIEQPAEAHYWIRCLDNTFRLTLPDDERPVFRRVDDYTEASAIAFISRTEKVANWRNLLDLSNPKTTIQDNEFDIQLYRVTDPGNEANDAPVEGVDWRRNSIFRYEKAGGEWKQPAFQMKIRNRGSRTLYFSALNLLDNFAVSNRFLPMQELAPGREAWLLDVFEGKTYQTIPLGIDDSYHTWGITEAKEYFKIIISTDSRLSTERYNQDGLELDVKLETAKRAGRVSSSQPAEPDWTTREIEMVVVRPMEAKTIVGGRDVALTETVKLTAPRGLTASASLTTVNEAGRGLAQSDDLELTFAPPVMRGGNHEAQAYEFTSGNHNSPALSVLELYDVQGREAVSADNPLAVQLSDPAAADEMIIPMGYDPETGLYFPLGFTTAEGEVRIQSLPEVSPTGTRSLVGSVKIFFQKVVLSKLGFAYQHPQLAIAKFAETGEDFTYETDTAAIKAAVAKANNIVLFIHGIIGNTSEMARILRRIPDNGQAAHPFDLALTFDYENLNTTIEENARLLKQRLEAVGLGAAKKTKLTIVAHSMGGLVSRWFIEKEGGNLVVKRLIQVGTPNGGSPWADVYQLSTALLTRAVNGAAFLQPYLFSLNILGRLAGQLFITLQQMDPDESEFLKQLNDGTDPGTPYTIVAGNTQLISPIISEAQRNLLRRVMERFRGSNQYRLLDSFLFKEPNDIAVSLKSIYYVPGSENWRKPPHRIEIGCDHISYFGQSEGLAALAEAIREA